jgi:hypothetical protein
MKTQPLSLLLLYQIHHNKIIRQTLSIATSRNLSSTNSNNKNISNNTTTSLSPPADHIIRLKDLQWKCISDATAFGGNSISKVDFTDNGGIHFHGTLADQNGFAAIIAPLNVKTNDTHIGDHRGVRIRIKPDDRRYSLNFTPESAIPEDMYQAFMVSKPNIWSTLEIGWDRLLLTSRGLEREEQREFDTETLLKIGFSVGGKGSKSGPFSLFVEEIKWVFHLQSEIEQQQQQQKKGL